MAFLTKKEIKFTFLITIIGTCLALGVVFTIYFLNIQDKDKIPEGVRNIFSTSYESTTVSDLKLQELALPDERSLNGLPERFFYREKKKIWSYNDIEKHWYPLEEIGIEALEKQNRAILEKKIMKQ